MLDAIVSPNWESRCYSFNSTWSLGTEMASIRDGSGDDLFLLFESAGAIMKGFAHESKMSQYQSTPPKIWNGIYNEVPGEFASFLKEPAFTIQDVTFCIWRTKNDSQWNHGTIQFPEGKDPDGSEEMLTLFDNDPESYARFAEEYYELELPLPAIEHIYRHEPLTEKLVRDIIPEVEFKDLKNDQAEIGYPQREV